VSLQGVIVGLLVVLAAAYVFRALAPRRWLVKLGLARSRAGSGPGPDGGDAGCGCSSCPPARKPRQS
jgi:hypothetical protein